MVRTQFCGFRKMTLDIDKVIPAPGTINNISIINEQARKKAIIDS